MESFSSLFELLAAFNAAFVVSTDFLDALNSRIIVTYDSLKKKLVAVDKAINKNTDSLESELANSANPFVKEQIEKMDEVRDKYESVKEDLHEKINKQSYPRFNFYCLFALFYAVFILFIVGLEAPIHPKEEDALKGQWALLFFNSIIIIFLLITLKQKSKVFAWANFDYKWSGIIFILGLVLSSLYCVIGGPLYCADNICKSGVVYYSAVFTSILLAGGHYLLFFGIAINNRIKRDEGLVQKINNLNIEVEDVEKNLQSVLSYIQGNNGAKDSSPPLIVRNQESD